MSEPSPQVISWAGTGVTTQLVKSTLYIRIQVLDSSPASTPHSRFFLMYIPGRSGTGYQIPTWVTQIEFSTPNVSLAKPL